MADRQTVLGSLGAAGCIEGPRLRLEAMGPQQAAELWRIYGEDAPLRQANGGAPAAATPEEFYAVGQRWADHVEGVTFAVVTRSDDRAIGTISLSRLSRPRVSIGYWLASPHWGIGLGGEAFDLVLQVARRAGLTAVEADNITSEASMRIWRRRNAQVSVGAGGRYSCVLSLKDEP